MRLKFRALFEQERDLGNILRWEYVGVNECMDNLLESCLEQKSPWLQYTNLKDKNEVEVFDGDIVKFTRWSGNWQTPKSHKQITDICEIKWREETHSLSLFYNSSFQKLRKLEGRYIYEVIGNIYENPEILEQG